MVHTLIQIQSFLFISQPKVSFQFLIFQESSYTIFTPTYHYFLSSLTFWDCKWDPLPLKNKTKRVRFMWLLTVMRGRPSQHRTWPVPPSAPWVSPSSGPPAEASHPAPAPGTAPSPSRSPVTPPLCSGTLSACCVSSASGLTSSGISPCKKARNLLLLLLLLMIWQSPGLPGWRKVNFITVTRRPHYPNIAAGLYCLATSPGFLPTLCEKWSGFFYVHRVFLSYTRDRRLKVSSERLGNEDKAPCPRALLPGRGSNRGPPVWKSEALTARPRQLLNKW